LQMLGKCWNSIILPCNDPQGSYDSARMTGVGRMTVERLLVDLGKKHVRGFKTKPFVISLAGVSNAKKPGRSGSTIRAAVPGMTQYVASLKIQAIGGS